ncbi:MAG: DNA polymerase III subunit delta [Christensenellales bacterium]|jgi:DNA polymerase-3 subunit delta
MDHNSIFSSLKSRIEPAYFFHGEEEFIKERALEALENAALGVSPRELNYSALTAPFVPDIITALETLPFMGEKRLVVCHDLRNIYEGVETLIKYFERFPSYACLVLYSKGNVDKRRSGVKQLMAACVEVKFDYLDEAEAARWLVSTARRHGMRLSSSDANHMVYLCGNRLLQLSGELDKLCSFAAGRSEITRRDIDTVVTRSLESNVFRMIDLFIAGNSSDGLSMLSSMLKDGERPIAMIGAAASKLRGLLEAARLLRRGFSPAAATSEMGGNYGARMSVSAAAGLSVEGIEKAVLELASIDEGIKTGKLRDSAALELFLLTSLPRPRKAAAR